MNLLYTTWPAEKEKLAELLSTAPGRYAVEVGCFHGATTVVLAEVCLRRGKTLVAIDPWDQRLLHAASEEVYQQFCENIQPYADVVLVIRDRSDRAVLPADLPGNCGFVFVDGCHEGTACAADLDRYYALLCPGGILVLHDTHCPGWEGVGASFRSFCRKHELAPSYLICEPIKADEAVYGHGRTGLGWVVK